MGKQCVIAEVSSSEVTMETSQSICNGVGKGQLIEGGITYVSGGSTAKL